MCFSLYDLTLLRVSDTVLALEVQHGETTCDK